MGWESLRQARGPGRGAVDSEHLRRKWDFIVQIAAALSAARQITAAARAISLRAFAIVRTRQHRHFALEARQHDLRRVVFLPALIGPFAGLQLTLDVDLRALLQESLGHVGNLGKDPEIRTTQAGGKIVSFTLATSESWTDKASGERKERTEWHRVVAFNEQIADVAERFLKKGAKVYVEG